MIRQALGYLVLTLDLLRRSQPRQGARQYDLERSAEWRAMIENGQRVA